MTDVCVAPQHEQLWIMVLKTSSLSMLDKKGNLTESTTRRTSNDSYLSGLNALGGLYAKLESSEIYIIKSTQCEYPSFQKNILKYVDLSENELQFSSCYSLESKTKSS
jgi:hypothetical protein